MSVLDELTEGVQILTPDEVTSLATKAIEMTSSVGEEVSKPITGLVMPLIATVNELANASVALGEFQFGFLNQILELDDETASVGRIKEMALLHGLKLTMFLVGSL